MKEKWEDKTSYSQGTKRGQSAARVWELGTGRSRIIVHRRIDAPCYWFLSCYALGVNAVQLNAADIEAARQEGLNRIGTVLRELNAHFKKLGFSV